ncbi:COG1361 family protein [Herbidospora sp. RD11066]
MGRWTVAALAFLVCGATGGPALAAGPGGHEGQWGGADLSVSIVATPKVAQPGQSLTYKVMVKNAGPGDAVLPTLTVRVPTDFKIVNVDVAECQPGRGLAEVVCRSSKDVAPGQSGGVVITGVVRPNALGPLRAQARLTSEVVDGHDSDNEAESVTRVDEGADLIVKLSAPQRDGRRTMVDAAVRNRGPRVVRDAMVYVDGAHCGGRSGCVVPPIRPGGTAWFRLAVRPGKGAVTAIVRSQGRGDRHPANNQASLTLTDRAASR